MGLSIHHADSGTSLRKMLKAILTSIGDIQTDLHGRTQTMWGSPFIRSMPGRNDCSRYYSGRVAQGGWVWSEAELSTVYMHGAKSLPGISI